MINVWNILRPPCYYSGIHQDKIMVTIFNIFGNYITISFLGIKEDQFSQLFTAGAIFWQTCMTTITIFLTSYRRFFFSHSEDRTTKKKTVAMVTAKPKLEELFEAHLKEYCL